MKICVAQVKPVTGDILENIENHKKYIELAASLGADSIFFPELSLTGYEPTLAKALAISQNDKRLMAFQKVSDSNNIVIGVGAPTRHRDGICISMIIFEPDLPRQVYSKQYLHKDEEVYFVAGKQSPLLQLGDHKIAIAICYEISVPAHSKHAFEKSATIYLVSAAKYRDGIEKAMKRLSQISDQYSMAVLMANCIGVADGKVCAGTSSIWSDRGILLAQMDDSQEGLLLLDTQTEITSVIL